MITTDSGVKQVDMKSLFLEKGTPVRIKRERPTEAKPILSNEPQEDL